MKKRNPIAEDLRTPKYKKELLNLEKEKVALKEKKGNILPSFQGRQCLR